jgi:hypothetical protein
MKAALAALALAAGISWIWPQWSVISEVFAVIPPRQSTPRYQSGMRYRLQIHHRQPINRLTGQYPITVSP